MARVRRLALLVLVVMMLGGLLPSGSQGQPQPTVRVDSSATEPASKAATPQEKRKSATPQKGPGIGRGSMLGFFSRSNPMVWLLGLCSIVTLGFTLERLVALRRERVIPRDFVNRFLERLAGGKLDRDRAAELCRANDSAVARVFAMVINYLGTAGGDHPPGARLRRRGRGLGPEAKRAGAQRHGHARPVARAARNGHRHDPVVRCPGGPGRTRERGGPGAGHQPRPGDHGARSGDRHRLGRRVLLFCSTGSTSWFANSTTTRGR